MYDSYVSLMDMAKKCCTKKCKQCHSCPYNVFRKSDCITFLNDDILMHFLGHDSYFYHISKGD